jgi:hypothetical protein
MAFFNRLVGETSKAPNIESHLLLAARRNGNKKN